MNIIIPKMPERTIELPKKSDILKGLALILLSRANLPGMYPLGLSFAAVFPAESAYIGLIGLCVGMAGTGTYILKYILAFFLYYILNLVRKREDALSRSIMLSVSAFFAGAISFLWTTSDTRSVLLLAPEAAATGCAFWLFTHLGEKTRAGAFALLTIAGGILNGLSGAVLPYINADASVFVAFFICMSLCFSIDIGSAVLASSVLGFIMYANSGSAVIMAGSFAIGAVFSALLAPSGKIGTAIGFLCGITVSALYLGRLEFQLMDIFLPICAFVVIPESIHSKICDLLYPDELDAPSGNLRIANQLKTAARAVCELANGVTLDGGAPSDTSQMKEMFDSVSARVCAGCSLEESCRKDYKKTYSNMYELWNVMEEDGVCNHSNMPRAFRQVCIRSESFLREFNHVYELYKQNALHRGESLSGRDIMARQYMQISNVINHLSREAAMGASEEEAPPARFRVQVSSMQEPKSGQSVCGDTLLHFEQSGKYYVILCDGMGSGEAALSESRLTARLFSEFLKAGFKKETALDMINSALALKADQESFSTVDLLEISLDTGICEFLKIGSAESFLKSKDGIEVIASKALPIGILEDVHVSAQSFPSKSGDMILMVSDGVGEAAGGVLKNEWIKKLMMMENRTDSELLQMILSGAKSRMRFSDDITGVVIRIKKGRSEAV